MKKTTHNAKLVGASIAGASFLLPLVTFAATRNLGDLVTLAIHYFNIAIFVIIDLAVLIFIWNVYRYFFKADPENKKEAGVYVMYSVIGFFVIISFWGIVRIVSNTLNLDTAPVGGLSIPSLNGGGSRTSDTSTLFTTSNPFGDNTTRTEGSNDTSSNVNDTSFVGNSDYTDTESNASAGTGGGVNDPSFTDTSDPEFDAIYNSQ